MSENEYGHANAAMMYGLEMANLSPEELAIQIRESARRDLLRNLDKWKWDPRFYAVLDQKLKDLLTQEEKQRFEKPLSSPVRE